MRNWKQRLGAIPSSARTLLAALAATALLAACGGGGDAAQSGDAGPGALTVGPISGFGSIIVNGVRFDDSRARVFDDDGVDVTDDHGRDALGLGAMVEIESGRIDDGSGRATALSIRLGSELQGPVASVDVASGRFVVLGQTIVVTGDTVFDDSLGVDGLAGLAGQIVEVHALFDAESGRYVATRVEIEDDADEYKLRGRVADHDAAAQHFRLGAAVISYAKVGAAALPAGFADGQSVRVKLETTPAADGSWIAISVRSHERKVEDRDDVRLRGTVSAFTSPTQFEVDGVPVDAASARIEDGPVTAGAFVKVRGTTVAGVLVASRVEIEDDDADDDHDGGSGDDDRFEFELHGAVGALDAATQGFTLRGVRVVWNESTRFDGGTVAQLVDGAQVEVKGRLSDDRSTLVATTIEFEDENEDDDEDDNEDDDEHED
jgi:hypothetical protein